MSSDSKAITLQNGVTTPYICFETSNKKKLNSDIWKYLSSFLITAVVVVFASVYFYYWKMYLFIIVNSYFRSLTWLDLILKMLLSRVTEKPFMWLPWFNCFCSKTTVVLSFDRKKLAIKILLSKRHLYSKPLTICIICQSKCHQWITLEFVTEYHYIKRKLAINM